MGLFFQPLDNISNYVQQLSVASSNLERIFETKDTLPSITDREGAYDPPPVQGTSGFENVSFAYDKGNNILENFNLEVRWAKRWRWSSLWGGQDHHCQSIEQN